jgi:dihydrofolate synthase/folylpolyglutamate synthase
MRFRRLQDWLRWQEQGRPAQIRLGLERVGRVWKRLRCDRAPCVFVSVAGTNGKGSSIALLESIFEAAGYRTAAYTSPHLLRYNERIRLSARAVDDDAICEAFDRVDRARGDTELTYFEFGTLAALDIFQRTAPDIALLEVGLGGRLDAVNIIDADIALITTIDLDHTQWLGSTRDQIAREKGGILRSGHPLVFASRDMPQALALEAKRLQAPAWRLGAEFDYTEQASGWDWYSGQRRRMSLPHPTLRGVGQLDNAAGVLMALELLSDRLPVTQQAVRLGLQSARLAGRFQVIPGPVDLILDVAHNRHAALALAANLRSRTCVGSTRAVCGMMADKDVEGVGEALDAQFDAWYLAPLDSPRALGADELAARLRNVLKRGSVKTSDSAAAALETALRQAEDGDRIVVFGSFLTVAGVLEKLPEHWR